MNVDPTGPVRAPPGTRRNERGGGPRHADFSRHLESTEGGGGVNGARPAAAVDALLLAQQVEGEAGGDELAKQRAHTLLEILDGIRHDVLAGAADRSRFVRLASLVHERLDQTVDPRPRGVLGEVELRAAVELAKLERADR